MYTIHALGVKRVSLRFERMGAAAVNAKPAMETIAGLLMRIFASMFESQGRRGGGSWKYDSLEWLAQKQRLGLDPRIMHATLTLRRSLTEPGAAHQELVVTNTVVRLGTSVPYAKAATSLRPLNKFIPSDAEKMRLIIREHLMAAWRGPA